MGKLRGRYLVQLGNLGLEGVLIIIFPFVEKLGVSAENELGVSAFIFISASMFATWAVGSTSALVPYVDREVVGSVAGIIGFAGGLGGILMIALTTHLSYTSTCIICGTLVLLSAFLALLLQLDGKDKSSDNIGSQEQDNADLKHTEEEDV